MYNTYEDELNLLIDKVEGVADYTWEDLVEELGLDIHPDSLRKSFTGGHYGGYEIAKYYQDKFTNEYCAEEETEKLESLKREIYKEKVKLRDQAREYRKHLSNEARFENLLDVVKEEASKLEQIRFNVNEIKDSDGTDAALLLSDIHFAAEVDNTKNFYNIEVAQERLNILLKKTIHYCNLHDVQTLYVNLLGDLCHGLIWTSTRVEQEEDVISQVLDIAEILTKFIATLAENVPNVKIMAVQGNHSRVTPNLKESLNPENFERIIFEWIRKRLPNIPMLTNGLEDYLSYKIGDRTVFIEHGDKSQVKSLKEKATDLLGYVPNQIFVGHWHRMEVHTEPNTDILINGSLMGPDSFAINHRLISSPHQCLRIFDGEDVCTYKLMLD